MFDRTLLALSLVVAAAACSDDPEPTADPLTPVEAIDRAVERAELEPGAEPEAEPEIRPDTVTLPPLTILTPEFGTEADDTTGDKVVLFLQGEMYRSCNGLSLPAPNFPLDSAKPKYEEAPELRALAKCLLSPAFKETTITLIGRADPRGDREYNRELAAKRSATIKSVLEVHGVAPERIKTMSAGEPAKGVDLRSYEDARRVDVMLTRGIPTPSN